MLTKEQFMGGLSMYHVKILPLLGGDSESLQTALAEESLLREDTDMNLQAAIESETNERKSAIGDLKARIGVVEVNVGTAPDLTAVYAAIDKTSDEIKDAVAVLRAADDSLKSALDDEATARELADEKLQAAIDAETQNRQAAVADLENRLVGVGEVDFSSLEAADAALQLAIDTESNARKAAVADLDGKISVLGTEPAMREAAIIELQNVIDIEANERMTADDELSTRISALEADTVQFAATDEELQLAWATETSERQAADTEINSRIAELATSIGGGGSSSEIILPTVASSVDGGFWYDAETHALWLRQGNYAYQFANASRIYVGDAQGALCAYLPLDTFVTEDAFDNTWTTYGSPIIQDGALYLDGSSYLYNETITDSIADSIGSQSWTVDFWHKVTQSSFDSCFFSVGAVNNDTGTDGYLHLLMKQYSMYFYNSVVPRENIDISPNLAPDDYVHIAVTYDGSTLRTFLNGVLMITAEASLTLKSRLGIGAAVVNNWGVVGYIDRVRIYNGIARWTGNFTPPTAEDYT